MNDKWLIWSNEHGAWWRPASRGYTRVIADAGVYSTEEAKAIIKNANHFQDDVNEVRIKAEWYD